MQIGIILSMIAIGIASNLDNAGVGIAYGVRKIKISWCSNLVIACLGFLATLTGGLLGNWLSAWMSPLICNIIGMIVLVTIGTWVLIEPFVNKKLEDPNQNWLSRILRNPESADWDHSKSIGFLESIALGVALSVNNLAGGFDAGITNLDIWTTSLISGVFSYICVGGCVFLGSRYAAEKLGKQASIVAGIILILVGIHQMM